MTIIELANQGLTARQIADAMGMSLWKTHRALHDLVSEGKLKHHTERKIASRVQRQGNAPMLNFIRDRHGLHVGNASDIVMSLTPEQLMWLGKTVPEGVTVAEFCCAVLRDLYDEETTV